jgi:hypothetical protein
MKSTGVFFFLISAICHGATITFNIRMRNCVFGPYLCPVPFISLFLFRSASPLSPGYPATGPAITSRPPGFPDQAPIFLIFMDAYGTSPNPTNWRTAQSQFDGANVVNVFPADRATCGPKPSPWTHPMLQKYENVVGFFSFSFFSLFL